MSDNFKKTDEAKYPKTEVVFVPVRRKISGTRQFEYMSTILRNEIKARENMRVVQIFDSYAQYSGVSSTQHINGVNVIFEEITTEMRDIESHIKSNSVRLEKKIDSLKTELESIKETIKSIYNII